MTRVRILGVQGGDATAAPVLDAPLAHGQDAQRLVWEHGLGWVRPLTAARDAAGELVVTVEVAASRDAEPILRPPATDPGLQVAPGETPEVRQRVAAYAVVLTDRGLLATEYSGVTNAIGAWGLPGGGLDPDEQPVDAVVREVYEETSQRVRAEELVTVQTSHWVGRAPSGRLEDFHAVRLVYRARCTTPTDPVVLDVGGTTSRARWVPLDEVPTLPWTSGWRPILDTWLP